MAATSTSSSFDTSQSLPSEGASPTPQLLPEGVSPAPLPPPKGASPAAQPQDEEAIFTMLFVECDSASTGIVAVESLVEYIRRMQLGGKAARGQEDVFDSHDDVPSVHYNLHLLQAMLECNAVEGMVDQATYSRVIRMWVKDVRDRSGRSSPQSLEVTQMTDSEDEGGGGEELQNYSYGSGHLSHVSQESFETTGGQSSTHTDLDRLELLSSVQDLRLDNRRIQERNQQLQLQMEQSEEHLKDLQTENAELKLRVKSMQQNLAQIEELQLENTELESAVHREQEKCQTLSQDTEKMEAELAGLRGELGEVRQQLLVAVTEREGLEEQQQALQELLLQKEEVLSQQEGVKGELEAQMTETQQEIEVLSRAVGDMGDVNEALRAENAELQSQLQQQKGKQPMSSTPYRPEAPSLHDELREGEMGRGSLSPMPATWRGVEDSRSLEESTSSVGEQSYSIDEFGKILHQAHSKFHQKTDLIMKGLSDLMQSQSPPGSQKSSTTQLGQDTSNDDSILSFERKLTDLSRRKKLSERNVQRLMAHLKRLHNENKQLRDQLAQLQRKLNKPPTTDQGVQTEATVTILGSHTPSLVTEAHISHTPSPEPPAHVSHTPSPEPPAHISHTPSLMTEAHISHTPSPEPAAVIKRKSWSYSAPSGSPPTKPPRPPPLSRTRDLSFLSDERMEQLLRASPEEVESRVRDLLLAVDTDSYTLPQRKLEMYRSREGALEDCQSQLEQVRAMAQGMAPQESQQRVEPDVGSLLASSDQLRPAVDTVMQRSEQYGGLLQEEHYAICIALLRTHIKHLKEKIASLQVAEEKLEGIRQRKLVRTGSSRGYAHSSVGEDGGKEATDFPGDEVDEETKEMAFQQAFDDAMHSSVSQDLATMKRRQLNFQQECSQLADRTTKMENLQREDWKDKWSTPLHMLQALPGSIYRLLKGTLFLLLIVVLALAVFVLLILTHGTVDGCRGGSACRHSLPHLLYSALEPHLQHARASHVPL